MASPLSLSDPAEKLRSGLAKWALEDAKQGQDYVVNEKGDRMYLKDKISPFVTPLLENMGLAVGNTHKIPRNWLTWHQGWNYTMWRFSITQPIEPSRPHKLYTIPINFISGKPQIVKDGTQSHIVLSCYTITYGAFEVTPELDCLFVGSV